MVMQSKQNLHSNAMSIILFVLMKFLWCHKSQRSTLKIQPWDELNSASIRPRNRKLGVDIDEEYLLTSLGSSSKWTQRLSCDLTSEQTSQVMHNFWTIGYYPTCTDTGKTRLEQDYHCHAVCMVAATGIPQIFKEDQWHLGQPFHQYSTWSTMEWTNWEYCIKIHHCFHLRSVFEVVPVKFQSGLSKLKKGFVWDH